MDKNKKEQVVAELREALTQAPSVVVASSFGMSANDVNEMRAKLRAQGVRYHVVKNTLAKLAISGTELEGLAEHFKGPTAVAWHAEDAVVTAKALVDYKKDAEKLELKAGYLGGAVLGVSGVEQLSKMPSLDESRATLLALMMQVPTNIARVINAVPQNILNVLNARKDSLS